MACKDSGRDAARAGVGAIHAVAVTRSVSDRKFLRRRQVLCRRVWLSLAMVGCMKLLAPRSSNSSKNRNFTSSLPSRIMMMNEVMKCLENEITAAASPVLESLLILDSRRVGMGVCRMILGTFCFPLELWVSCERERSRESNTSTNIQRVDPLTVKIPLGVSRQKSV